jgi:hypothetical protein
LFAAAATYAAVAIDITSLGEMARCLHVDKPVFSDAMVRYYPVLLGQGVKPLCSQVISGVAVVRGCVPDAAARIYRTGIADTLDSARSVRPDLGGDASQ